MEEPKRLDANQANKKPIKKLPEKNIQESIEAIIGAKELEQFLADARVYKKGNLHKEQTEEQAKKKVRSALKSYISNYTIINKKAFNKKIRKIAKGANRLIENLKPEQKISFITSYPDKSNFWVTIKVLEQIPQDNLKHCKIHAYKGVKETGTDEYNNINVEEVNKSAYVIFLDDGAYSGSQLSRLLGKFKNLKADKIKLGIVAMSKDAMKKVENGDKVSYLARPITIKKPNEEECIILNNLAATMCPDKFGLGSEQKHKPGLYQTAFYYKIPDYASTMDYILNGDRPLNVGKPMMENSKVEAPYKDKNYLYRYCSIDDKDDKELKSEAKIGKKVIDLKVLAETSARAQNLRLKNIPGVGVKNQEIADKFKEKVNNLNIKAILEMDSLSGSGSSQEGGSEEQKVNSLEQQSVTQNTAQTLSLQNHLLVNAVQGVDKGKEIRYSSQEHSPQNKK